MRVMESTRKVAWGLASEIFSQLIRVFLDKSAHGYTLVARNALSKDRCPAGSRLWWLLFANLNRILTHGNCDRLGFSKFASWQRFYIRKSFHHYPISSQPSHVVCQKYEIAALLLVLAVLVSKRTFWLGERAAYHQLPHCLPSERSGAGRRYIANEQWSADVQFLL